MKKRRELIEQLLHSFHLMHSVLRARLASMEHEGFLTHARWFVLTMIQQFGKRSIKQIARAMDISSSAATQLVDPLVEGRLVMRKEDPADRRLVQLELTAKGRKHINA